MNNLLKNRSGYTLVETIIAAGLVSFVLIGTLALLNNMLGMWVSGMSGTSANSYTSLAMRKLVLDIEEGKYAEMLGTFTAEDGTTLSRQLRVTFPYYNSATNSYVKTQYGSTVTYFLSGPNGTENSGNCLWRSSGGNLEKLSDNIESIRFSVTNGVLVKIQLKGRDPEHGAIDPNFRQQAIKLRNS